MDFIRARRHTALKLGTPQIPRLEKSSFSRGINSPLQVTHHYKAIHQIHPPISAPALSWRTTRTKRDRTWRRSNFRSPLGWCSILRRYWNWNPPSRKLDALNILFLKSVGAVLHHCDGWCFHHHHDNVLAENIIVINNWSPAFRLFS